MDPSSAESPFSAGHVVAGKYRVARVLGAGSFGWVVEARREADDVRAALKVLRPEAASMGGGLDRFVRRELEILKRVHARGSVPEVVRVLEPEVLDESGRVIIVLELVEGPSLGDVIAKERLLDQGDARGILVDVARGLAAIHRAGGVHRDLKPDNVRLRADGRAVILDLGIAKAMWTTERLTRSAEAPMTPLYASPEQLTGEEVTPATDVYALGLIGYEMLSGAVPLSGRTLMEMIRARTDGRAPDIRAFGRPVSEDLARVVARCLEHDPKLRPSPTQIVDDLTAALAATRPSLGPGSIELAVTEPIAVAPPSEAPPASARSRLLWPGVVAATLAVGVVVLVVTTSTSTPTSASTSTSSSALSAATPAATPSEIAPSASAPQLGSSVASTPSASPSAKPATSIPVRPPPSARPTGGLIVENPPR